MSFQLTPGLCETMSWNSSSVSPLSSLCLRENSVKLPLSFLLSLSPPSPLFLLRLRSEVGVERRCGWSDLRWWWCEDLGGEKAEDWSLMSGVCGGEWD